MAELGAGTGTSYPSSLDTDNTLEVNSPNAGKTKARAECINDLNTAVVAIQTELGTDPAGTKTDVKTFLQVEHGTDGTHSNVDPLGIGDLSADATAMRVTTDPYPAGSESLPTTLVGEAQRLRYLLKQITGSTQWYIFPDLVSKTTTYTATLADRVILCDASGGAWTLTLPTAVGNTDKVFYIKKTDSSANAVTIDGNASETIDGAATVALSVQYHGIVIVSNGTNWFEVGGDRVGGFRAFASATASQLLALNSSSKLPASITGDADTVDGFHAAALAKLTANTFSDRQIAQSNSQTSYVTAALESQSSTGDVYIALHAAGATAAALKHVRSGNGISILDAASTLADLQIRELTAGTVKLARMMRLEVQGSTTASNTLTLDCGTVVAGDRILVSCFCTAQITSPTYKRVTIGGASGTATINFLGAGGNVLIEHSTAAMNLTTSTICSVTAGGTKVLDVAIDSDGTITSRTIYGHAIVLNNG